MKPARLLVLAVAGLAAGGAAMLMMQSPPAPDAVVVEKKGAVATTDVLIAATDLPIGQTLRDADIRWQAWPSDLVPPGAIARADGQNAALTEFEGSIVRQALLAGEPVRREKLVKANSNAFMSAILPTGMRAYAINIDTRGSNAAGGFILPNDRVDILRIYRDDEASKSGGVDVQNAETLLPNIRVLAIGQNVQDRNGEKVVTGETATLEVTPSQAETLALGQRTGQLSLVLRSLADAGVMEAARQDKADGSLTLVRYGVARSISRK